MPEFVSRYPDRSTLTSDDERFMLEALREAWKAYENNEVPVGAVIVKDGRIIARGSNQVEMLRDATAHAEMLSITAAEEAVDNWRLAGCTIYSTLEPCAMCAGALLLARIDSIVWGAPDIRHGANGSWVDLFSIKHPTHAVSIKPRVLEEWCKRPLQEFFRKRRVENDLLE